MSDDDGETEYKIDASLGSLELEVRGDDDARVSEIFDEKLDRMLDEAAEMSSAVRDGKRRFR